MTRPSTMPHASHFLFGKLPHRADFLRINASDPVVDAFDSWLQRGLDRMSEQADWEAGYRSIEVAGFRYGSGDARHALIGTLQPSRDRTGRSFPLVGGIRSEPAAAAGPVTPIAYEVLLEALRSQLRSAVDNAEEALDCQAFLLRQSSMGVTAGADVDLAGAVGAHYLETTPIDTMDQLLRNACAPATLVQALLNIAFYAVFLRRFDTPSARQAIVLPLPAAQGEAALAAGAWLRLIQALYPPAVDGRADWCAPYVLWRRKGQPWQLMTTLGAWPDGAATLLLGGRCEVTALLDLAAEQPAWLRHPQYPEISYALQRVVGDSQSSLAALHAFLKDVGRMLAGIPA